MPIRSRTTRFVDPFEPEQIRRLVAEFGSPLLIIDCERVRLQLRKLQQALPRVDLHYALKPLPHPAVVQVVMEEGGFLDLATTGEVQLVKSLGASPERCIHTHPIKRAQDIRNAMDFGVQTFVADNPDEVRKFARIREGARLLLRVSFRSPGAVCDLSRKFGCDPEDFMELARLAAGLGIDVHPRRLTGRRSNQACRGDRGVRQTHRRGAAREAGDPGYPGYRRWLSHRVWRTGA
jgi:ornithine decarboxylase